MAGTIQVQASIECNNGNFKLPKLGGSVVSVTQNTVGGGIPGQISATTAGVDVSFSGIATPGFVWLKNLDGTNYVEWGPKSGGTFYPIGMMKAGDPPVPFRLANGVTLHLKANTATCKVQVIGLED